MTIKKANQERDEMMKELNAEVVSHLGFTRGQLQDAFKVLTKDMENWKDPILKVIRKDEIVIMREACSFFTGSFLEVEQEKGQFCIVSAEGYYMAVGS